jgi:hypothetical protein
MLGSQLTENDRNFMVDLGAGPGLKLGFSSPDKLLEAVKRSYDIIESAVDSMPAEKPKGTKVPTKKKLTYDPATKQWGYK